MISQYVEIANEFYLTGIFMIGGVNYKTNSHLVTANNSSKMQFVATVLVVVGLWTFFPSYVDK